MQAGGAPRGGGRAEPPDGLHAAHGGEMVGGGRAQARAGVPVARADVLGEAADAPRAEAQGRGSAAVDVFPVQEGGLQRLFGDTEEGIALEDLMKKLPAAEKRVPSQEH